MTTMGTHPEPVCALQNDKGGDTLVTPTVPPTNNVLYANTSKTLAQTYQPRWCAALKEWIKSFLTDVS